MNARLEGSKAMQAGKFLSDNPYPLNTPQYFQWRKGWAMGDAYYDRVKIRHPMDDFLQRRFA